MSAVICGKRSSSIFEEHQHLSPPSSSKRLRCYPAAVSPPPSSSKRLRCYPAAVSPPPSIGLSHLQSMFPDMDPQLLMLTLDACGNDVESAIKSLSGLSMEEPEGNSVSGLNKSDAQTAANAQPSEDVFPVDGSEWVELLVKEMMCASNADDAKSRASRVLGMLEKHITANTGSEAIHTLGQENAVLKEQNEIILRENSVLKRAVAIQQERLKNQGGQNQELQQLKQLVSRYQDQMKNQGGQNQELQQLKQLVSRYQDQMKKLEMSNYALTMHLRQAQQSSSISGHFHPDVY